MVFQESAGKHNEVDLMVANQGVSLVGLADIPAGGCWDVSLTAYVAGDRGHEIGAKRNFSVWRGEAKADINEVEPAQLKLANNRNRFLERLFPIIIFNDAHAGRERQVIRPNRSHG